MHGSKTQRGKETVQDTGVLQNGHPGVGADQEVHPHGNHNQRYHGLLSALFGTGHDIGHGISQQQADNGGNHCQLDRPHEDQKIGSDLHGGAVLLYNIAGCGKEAGDILGGKRELVVRKGVIGNEGQRHHHKQGRPKGVGSQSHPVAVLGMPAICGSHSSSSPPGLDSSSSSLEKEE